MKFAQSYGRAIHEAWAAKGFAPRLYECQRLPGTTRLEMFYDSTSSDENDASLHWKVLPRCSMHNSVITSRLQNYRASFLDLCACPFELLSCARKAKSSLQVASI